jgi:hypothetical protein
LDQVLKLDLHNFGQRQFQRCPKELRLLCRRLKASAGKRSRMKSSLKMAGSHACRDWWAAVDIGKVPVWPSPLS